MLSAGSFIFRVSVMISAGSSQSSTIILLPSINFMLFLDTEVPSYDISRFILSVKKGFIVLQNFLLSVMVFNSRLL